MLRQSDFGMPLGFIMQAERPPPYSAANAERDQAG